MEFIEWWGKKGKEMRKTWVMLGAFALPTIAKAAWDAAKVEAAREYAARCRGNHEPVR